MTANQGRTVKAASASSASPAWYTAEVNAQELQRRQALAADVFPAPIDDIKSDGGPSSKLWCQVEWHREGIGNRVVFDIAQGMRIAVHTCEIQMSIVLPSEFRSVRGSGTPDPDEETTPFITGAGLYLNTLIRTSLTEGCATPLRRTATLTQTFVIPAGATREIPCPPGAIGAEIYVTTLAGGLAPVVLVARWMELVDPTGALPAAGPLGLITLPSVSGDRSGNAPRPGNAAGLQSVNTSNITLVYTYIWNLEF